MAAKIAELLTGLGIPEDRCDVIRACEDALAVAAGVVVSEDGVTVASGTVAAAT